MIISRREIQSKKIVRFDEDFQVNIKDIESNPDIIEVIDVRVILEAQEVVDLVVVKYRLIANLILRSTRTLKPVDFKIDEEVDLTLCFEENEYDDESIIQVDSDEYDMYDEIMSTLVTSIPMKIIGPDDPETVQGDKWEVISEDEYYSKKKEQVDPRFAKLLDFDFDDEE